MKSSHRLQNFWPAFLAASLLLLGSVGQVRAQGYWDALFELGFDPAQGAISPVTACGRIEKIHAWKARVAGSLAADKELLATIRDLDARMTSLDAGNLYDLADYSGPAGNWRGVGIRGVSDSQTYRLTLADPKIENWLKDGGDSKAWLQEGQQHLGDIGLRAFIKPLEKDTYKFISEGSFYLQELPAANLMRVLDHLLANIRQDSLESWKLAHAHPLPERKNTAGLTLLAGFAGDFPNLFKFIRNYFEIDAAVSLIAEGANKWVALDLTLRGNRAALLEDYPSIWRLMKLLEGTIAARTRVLNERGQMVATVAFNSGKDFFGWRVSVLNNRPAEMDAGKGPRIAGAFSLIEDGSTRLAVFQDITLDLLGLHILVEDLEMTLDYTYHFSGPRLAVRLNRLPKEIGAGGQVFHVIPIWLVDIMIPSTVEEVVEDFFQTLAAGDGGRGATLEIASADSHPSGETLWVRMAADILSNGTIKLGFNLQRRLLAQQESLLVEADAFRNNLWSAFDRDFQRVKSRGRCR